MTIELMTGISGEQIDKLNAEVNQDLVKLNKYDKFGDGQYLTVDTYRRLLNNIFGFVWSFEIVETREIYKAGTNHEEIEFVLVKGRLSIPGVGVKEAYGTGKADKKDNSSMHSAATSYAFKACAKMLGIGAAFNDENFSEPLFEDEVNAPAPKEKAEKNDKKSEDKHSKKDDKVEEKEEKKSSAKDTGWTDEEIKKINQLKKTYDIQTKEEFVAFAQIWNPKIKDIKDLDPDTCMDLYDYVEENSEEFEDYDPSEVA